jgi:hypothetical protein
MTKEERREMAVAMRAAIKRVGKRGWATIQKQEGRLIRVMDDPAFLTKLADKLEKAQEILSLNGVEYYLPYKPKKRGPLFVPGVNTWYEIPWFFSDHYILLAHWKPTVPKGRTCGYSTAGTPDISEFISRYRCNWGSPLEIVGEMKTHKDRTPLVHLLTGKGESIGLQARYVDSILTAHPEATPWGRDTESPVLFYIRDRLVGMVMPCRLNDAYKLLLEDRA